MTISITKIGNSQGIRIPKNVLAQLNNPKELKVEVSSEKLVLTPLEQKRASWSKQFSQEKSEQESFTDVQDVSNTWDKEEWEW